MSLIISWCTTLGTVKVKQYFLTLHDVSLCFRIRGHIKRQSLRALRPLLSKQYPPHISHVSTVGISGKLGSRNCVLHCAHLPPADGHVSNLG